MPDTFLRGINCYYNYPQEQYRQIYAGIGEIIILAEYIKNKLAGYYCYLLYPAYLQAVEMQIKRALILLNSDEKLCYSDRNPKLILFKMSSIQDKYKNNYQNNFSSYITEMLNCRT